MLLFEIYCKCHSGVHVIVVLSVMQKTLKSFLIRLYMSKSVSSIYNCECIFSLLYDIILQSSQKFILLQCLMICVAYLVTISRTWNFIVKYSVVWINKRMAEQHLIYIKKCNISLHTGATETF